MGHIQGNLLNIANRTFNCLFDLKGKLLEFSH